MLLCLPLFMPLQVHADTTEGAFLSNPPAVVSDGYHWDVFTFHGTWWNACCQNSSGSYEALFICKSDSSNTVSYDSNNLLWHADDFSRKTWSFLDNSSVNGYTLCRSSLSSSDSSALLLHSVPDFENQYVDYL
jgi:hypothetical protein